MAEVPSGIPYDNIDISTMENVELGEPANENSSERFDIAETLNLYREEFLDYLHPFFQKITRIVEAYEELERTKKDRPTDPKSPQSYEYQRTIILNQWATEIRFFQRLQRNWRDHLLLIKFQLASPLVDSETLAKVINPYNKLYFRDGIKFWIYPNYENLDQFAEYISVNLSE